jgi:hypothetical protein
MEYLKNITRQGPMAITAWIGVYAVMAGLAGLSLLSAWIR